MTKAERIERDRMIARILAEKAVRMVELGNRALRSDALRKPGRHHLPTGDILVLRDGRVFDLAKR